MIFIFIFGTIIGSFLNCLIWRMHKNEGMMNRSYCPKCKKQISWYDNIPILSFIALRGKCRHCQKKISWQYPIVEFITGIFFVIAFLFNINDGLKDFINFDIFFLFNEPIVALRIFRDWFIISIMIIIFIYDLRWYLILDRITLTSCAVIFIINLFLGISWFNLLIYAVIGGGFFLLQFIISQGKWIGGGDIRLGMLMGVIFGRIDFLLLAIFLSYFLGSIVGIGLILLGKKKWGSKIPLGVFLSFSTLITIFLGKEILMWYFGILG